MSTKPRDRLHELSQERQDTNVTVEDEEETSPEIKEIYDKVQIIRGWISNIQENTRVIKDLIQSSANALSTKLIHNEIEKRVKNITATSGKINTAIKEFDVKSTSDKSALARIKRIQYASLKQEFQNVIFENNELLECYRDRQKTLLAKQAALVNTALNEEELESLLSDPDKAQLFTGNILNDTQIARQELRLIEERHSELLKIEVLLQEVRDQFLQLAILVEQQKDHVNRIEFHALDAINYVDTGVVQIQKANRSKKRTRKIYSALFFMLIGFLITLVIFSFVH